MSRYPTLGRGGYDESLLQIAPQVTKADRQQGYSVDILERGGPSNFNRPQVGPNPPRPQQFAQGSEQPRSQQGKPPQQPVSSYGYDLSAPPPLEKADYYSSSASLDQRDVYKIDPYVPPKKPWFRTKRGLGIIFLIVVLLAGAAVGIALGISTTVNKANADRQGVQPGAQQGSGGTTGGGGVSPSGAEAGSGAASTNDPNNLPSLPTLSLISLNLAQQAAPTATGPVGVNPAPAANAVVQSLQGPPAPAQVSLTTIVLARPTPTPKSNVDPVCQRFPSLPSCQ